MPGKIAVSTPIDESTLKKLDALCAETHRSRSAVLRGLLYAALGEPPLQPGGAFRGNTDGKGEAALAFVKANVELSNEKIARFLKAAGIPRSVEWVRRHKYDIRQQNGGIVPAAR
jgi:hypothetical protein